jgi:hypothetical protein
VAVHVLGLEGRPKVVKRIAYRTGTSIKAVKKALAHYEAGTLFNEKTEKRVQ